MKYSSGEGFITGFFYIFSHKKIVYWLFFLKIVFVCWHPVCYGRNFDNSLIQIHSLFVTIVNIEIQLC